MDYNFGKFADVQFIDTSTGEILGQIQSLNTADIETDGVYAKSNNFDYKIPKSFSLTMEDVTFNHDVFDQLLGNGTDFDVVVVSENRKLDRLKYLHKRTKNRRIKNKLIKKIHKLDHPIYSEGIKMKYSDITFM